MPNWHKKMMDLKHLRTFVAVSEYGTVSEAALRLHTAQPALSRQIMDLEKELGIKLFDRVGRRLRLTGEGEAFLGNWDMQAPFPTWRRSSSVAIAAY